MFRQMLRLPAHYYDATTSGKLLSKLLYNVEQLAQISADAVTDLVQSAFLLIGLFVVMFMISWQLSLLYFITVPIIAMVVQIANKRVRRISHQVQETMAEITEIAEESIEGYRVVRIFSGEKYETAKFDRANERSRARDMKVAMTKSLNVAGVQLIAAAGLSVIIYLAVVPGSLFVLTAGDFASIMAAMLALLKPLKTITRVNSKIQRGIAGAQSVFEMLDELPEVDKGQRRIQRADGRLQFQSVGFSYNGMDKQVLHDINFEVKTGETVALVGRSGSGKSTLVNLLPRFYEIDQGMIILDGIDIRDIVLHDLRRQIAVVSQQVILFNDTLANNIAYGAGGNISEARIRAAAKSAHALEFIDNLAEGLQTLVGENGVLLSGGQRQRLAIARAILKDAPILIFDEATSALDTEAERHIQAAMDEVMRNRTTLVIAHRLSTIEKADKIIVMDAGRIVEMGTHQSLLAENGLYAKLYEMQFNSPLVTTVKEVDDARSVLV